MMMKKSLLLALLCMWATTACTSKYSENYEKAKASLDLNASCDVLWEELWPAARNGDYTARDLLAELVAERGLRIPGQQADDWRHTYLTLGVHKHMLQGSKDNTKKKMDVLSTVKYPEGASVGTCFFIPSSFGGHPFCVSRAVKYGLIQPYEDFVKSVDKHLQAGEKATCADESFLRE